MSIHSLIGNSKLLDRVTGSLIKLVYFSRHPENTLLGKLHARNDLYRAANLPGLKGGFPILGGRLHFVKFETAKINECMDFIQSKRLHYPNPNGKTNSHLESLCATTISASKVVLISLFERCTRYTPSTLPLRTFLGQGRHMWCVEIHF